MSRLNIDRALSAPRGISLDDDEVGIFAGEDDPRLIDEGVPISSTYHRTNGELWQKIEQPNNWQIIKPGYKAGLVPVELVGGTGDEGIQIEDTTFIVELSDGTEGSIN